LKGVHCINENRVTTDESWVIFVQLDDPPGSIQSFFELSFDPVLKYSCSQILCFGGQFQVEDAFADTVRGAENFPPALNFQGSGKNEKMWQAWSHLNLVQRFVFTANLLSL